MEPTRVLHLIATAAFLGAERVICELISASDIKNFHMTVGLLGSSSELEQEFRQKLSLEANLLNFPCEAKFDAKCLIMIRRFFVDNKINIIHCHGYKAHVYGLLAVQLCTPKPVLIATNHTWKLNSFFEKVYKEVDVIALRLFNRVIAVSEEIRDEMINRRIPGHRIDIIKNGISLPDLSDHSLSSMVRSALGIAPGDLVIGCVASLTPEKAHHDLIAAFKKIVAAVPIAKLIIVGDGPTKVELQELIRASSLEQKVIFLGPRKDVITLYRAFDIFALVSYAEGLPMAMLEAMAAALPVVVTSVGAMPHVVIAGENGLVVEPRDIDTIANALLTLALRPDIRRQLGDRARAVVVDGYTAQRMARDHEALYLRCTC